jgi:hypothetical protein
MGSINQLLNIFIRNYPVMHNISGNKIINYIASDSYYFYRDTAIGHTGRLLENIKAMSPQIVERNRISRVAKAKYIYCTAKLEIKRVKKIYINLRNGK